MDELVGPPPPTACDVSPGMQAELEIQAQGYVASTRTAFDTERREMVETLQRVEQHLDKRIDDMALLAVITMSICCASLLAVLLWALFRRSEDPARSFQP